jgi:hypothetical protein
MVECELCRVVRDVDDAEFRRRYPAGATRTVHTPGGVVVMPTLGSLGQIHALVLPDVHVRSTAGASAEVQCALRSRVGALRAALAESGRQTIIFEHGLPEDGGHGCGVEHAHIHVVQLPADHLLQRPPGRWEARRCDLAEVTIDRRREYLLVGLPDGEWLLRYEANVESQFLRKWLARELGHDQWDWRNARTEDAIPIQVARLESLLNTGALAGAA